MHDPSAIHYSLDELSALTGISRRTIRYYIQLGLVDRPSGETRGARYGPQHVEQLGRVRRLSAEGFSLRRIRTLLHEPSAGAGGPPAGTAETWTRLFLADGIELGLNPGRTRLSPDALRALIQGVSELYAALRERTGGQTDGNAREREREREREPDREPAHEHERAHAREHDRD